MINGSDKKLPTSTVTPIRLCVFQATRRPVQAIRTVATAFGSLTVDGRLGQAHADLMECVMFCAEKHRIENGQLQIIVDPYRVRMVMGGGKQFSAEQIKTLRRDLLKAIMTIETDDFRVHGHAVEKVVVSKLTKPDPREWATGERHLEAWVFSKEWTELIKDDIARHYNPTPLCRIDRGGVAAIARHVLTHQHQPNGGWKLGALAKAAGVERRADKVRRDMQDNAGALAELGIHIEDDRVFLATPARGGKKNKLPAEQKCPHPPGRCPQPPDKSSILSTAARKNGVLTGISGFSRKPEIQTG